MNQYLFSLFALSPLCAACSSPPSTLADGGPVDAKPDGPAALPDLSIFGDRSRSDITIEVRNFEETACELDPEEACIGAPGERRLLRFSVETPNIGEGNLQIGEPSGDNEDFQFSFCHGHFHFRGYASYGLVDNEGNDVLEARKQAFCLVDSRRFVDEEGIASNPRFSCVFQGIQAGWSDVYVNSLPCQYLDVTDLPAGEYRVVVDVNTEDAFDEADTTNNHFEMPITLGDPNHETPTEECPADLEPMAVESRSRECAWAQAETIDCTPGALLRIACASNCFLGSCTGDPMLRVCDSEEENCSNAVALASNDDGCASACPEVGNVECPASGQLVAYTAAKSPGQPFECNLEWQEQ